MRVPVNEPLISEEAKKNILEAVETGWISSAGKFVEEFENKFASYLGVKHAITTNNGTTALHTALLTMNIGPGDEVIVPAFTMIATIFAVMYTGAKPVFVDCELETYNLDPAKLEEKITKNTKAIMPVHIYGHSCDMDPILEIAQKHNLIVIEDAAEAHGATYKGRICGSMSDIACFSFYGNKIITTGEGGMVVTNDDAIAEKARKLKDLYHSDTRFIHEHVGYNYRMTNMQAAIGCGELQHIDEYIEKKNQMAERYNSVLKDIPGIKLPTTLPKNKNVFWMYAILIEEEFGKTKDEVRTQLKEVDIDTRDFFYSPTDQPVLINTYGDIGSYPNTDYIAKHGLYLPSGLAITDEQIDYVCEQMKLISQSA
ncbi:MAG: DegT/DnrJ/EryC1/StrS family aminotransferase [bacterium]|nr:DegT/DnrJ/EryC1/StrS family aminotransferase [bacterium]